jgi:hypothetical protein
MGVFAVGPLTVEPRNEIDANQVRTHRPWDVHASEGRFGPLPEPIDSDAEQLSLKRWFNVSFLGRGEASVPPTYPQTPLRGVTLLNTLAIGTLKNTVFFGDLYTRCYN